MTTPEAASQAVSSDVTDQRLLDLLGGFRRTQLIYVAARLGLADLSSGRAVFGVNERSRNG